MMSSSNTPSYTGYRFPAEVISYAVWLYFRFPLSLRMVEEMLAFRGIEVSHETIRQWGARPARATPQAVISARSSPTSSVGGCPDPATSGISICDTKSLEWSIPM